MEIYRMLRAGWGVIKGRVTKPSPLFVIWAATNRCTSHCSYCKIPERLPADMTTEEVFSMIDQITQMGCQRLGIWGGEPLIRDDIGEIVDYAASKNLYITLITNGYLLPQKIDKLKRLHHFLISIDGPEEVNDANREKGSFKKALAAIKMATERNMKVWTITVLTKNNSNPESIDFLLDLADKYKFITTFQLLHHDEDFGDSQTLRPSDEDYRNILKYIIKKKKEGRRIGTSFHALEHLLTWKDYAITRLPEKKNGKHCWGGKFMVNVDADGKLYPCSLLVGKVKGEDFRKVGFREAYEKIPPLPCHQCLATCYTEYNLLFDMDFATIYEWVRAFRWR